MNKEYWVLVLNGLYLLEGEGIKLSKFVRGAKRFPDKETALQFAYGDRTRRGDTAAQKICGMLYTKPEVLGMSASEAMSLGLKLTSVLESNQ